MIDDGAVGAAQGHLHGLCPCRRAAGALVLHVLGVDGVQGFAVTLTLQWGREGQGTEMVEKPGVRRTLGQPASLTCAPPSQAALASPEIPGQQGSFER